MAKPADNLREAVERTVDATIGSADRGRSAAQGALDDLRGAIEGRRPASYDDIKELRKELRAIGRRLDKIEERLPERRGSSKRTSKS
jgi:hypothetical protein